MGQPPPIRIRLCVGIGIHFLYLLHLHRFRRRGDKAKLLENVVKIGFPFPSWHRRIGRRSPGFSFSFFSSQSLSSFLCFFFFFFFSLFCFRLGSGSSVRKRDGSRRQSRHGQTRILPTKRLHCRRIRRRRRLCRYRRCLDLVAVLILGSSRPLCVGGRGFEPKRHLEEIDGLRAFGDCGGFVWSWLPKATPIRFQPRIVFSRRISLFLEAWSDVEILLCLFPCH